MGTKEAKKHAKEKVKKDSDSDSSDSEHELSYYINDRIKLMQQVLGLIKPKKIISMAPDSMKDMQPSAMKSLLLEELLGISNKRLRSILAGENFDDDTSSDSQIDKDETAEVISLDDITDGSEIYISDDNNCMEIQLSERERLELEKENPSGKKSKDKLKKHKEVVVKNENEKKRKKHKKKSSIKEEKIDDTIEEPVVNVLNLLELQARARAIRSQLASEILSNTNATNTKDKSLIDTNNIKKSKSDGEGSDSDSVICVSPQNAPVVMIQSNSEAEDHDNLKSSPEKVDNEKKTENTEPEINKESEKNPETNMEININKELASPININSNDEDYNNDVLIVTEDDITLDKDTILHSKENPEPLDDNAEDDPCTWKTRWLESKKVKDVMKTTKLYNSLRQKRKQKRTDSEEQDTDTPETNIETKDTTISEVDNEIGESSKITEEANSPEDKNLPIQENSEIENVEKI